MKFDKNTVLTIIEEHFWNELYNYIFDYVMNLDGDELFDLFENSVDYAELDEVNQLEVDNIEVEEDNDTLNVIGRILAEVSLDGYTYWDGENVCIGSVEHFIDFEFSFEVCDEKYSGFEMG